MNESTAVRAEVGVEIPAVVRPNQGMHHWNRYAAVNDEFIGIHMIDDDGVAAGYPSAFAMGNMSTSYLHIMLRNWIGESGRIVSLSMQFRAPVLKGYTVSARGVITGVRVEGNERFVDLDVWTENTEGLKIAPGSATVAIPA